MKDCSLEPIPFNYYGPAKNPDEVVDPWMHHHRPLQKIRLDPSSGDAMGDAYLYSHDYDNMDVWERNDSTVADHFIASCSLYSSIDTTVDAHHVEGTNEEEEDEEEEEHLEPVGAGDELDDEIALFDVDLHLETEVLPNQVESMTAQEMNLLSTEDREKVYYDLHGVSSEVKETQAFVNERLVQLHQILNAATETHDAYRLALSMNPAYVHSSKFLMRFLRADNFDVNAACERIGRHFELKLELFGPELLARDIVQDDLNKDDLDWLYNGHMIGYELPFRDRAGRSIYFQHTLSATPANDEVSIQTKLRRGFYAFQPMSEDEETQRAGIVVVTYAVGVEISFQQIAQRKSFNSSRAKLMAALPVRVEAIHFCYDSIMWKPVYAAFKLHSLMFNRVRMREHYGNAKDVLFSLQTFGIPTMMVQEFPVTPQGEILKHLHDERWEKRRKIEQMQRLHHHNSIDLKDVSSGSVTQPEAPVRVGTPWRYDVLLGRGKAYYSHVGNLRMRNLVLEWGHRYEEASFTCKHRVVKDLVKLVKQGPGRFLREDGAGWVEVDDQMAEKKVSAALRTLRGIRNAAASGDQQDTTTKRSKKTSRSDSC